MHYFPDPHEGRARREAGDEAWAQRAAGAYEAAVLRSDGDGTERLAAGPLFPESAFSALKDGACGSRSCLDGMLMPRAAG